MVSTSTSTRYIGYVGGVAVAAGVGAAIAVAGQGTAHADSTDGASKESTRSSTSQQINTGPKRGTAKTGDTKPAKPLSKFKDTVFKDTVKDDLDKQADKIEKAAAHVTKAVQGAKAVQDAGPAKPVAVKLKPKPSAEEFEAGEVAKLKELFTPKQAAAPKTETAARPGNKTSLAPKLAAAQTQADTADGGQAWDPNPFRGNDPEPTDIPAPIMELRNALMEASPNELKPLVREATEQIYRGSQMIPWVNAVIPIGKIVENLAPAVGSDVTAARDARQTIINELIKTTPPGSFVYYGYDLVADVINLETPGAQLKGTAVATVWDLLDPFQLAHQQGHSGIGS